MAEAFETAVMKVDRTPFVDFLINNGAKVDGYWLRTSPGLEKKIENVRRIQDEEAREGFWRRGSVPGGEALGKLEMEFKKEEVVEELRRLDRKAQRWMAQLRMVSSMIIDDVEWHALKRETSESLTAVCFEWHCESRTWREPDSELFNRRFSKVPAFR